MDLFYDIEPLRDYVFNLKDKNQTIAYVPTIGALHKGHESLISYAKTLADKVIVSIFVNPTQFSPNEDFQEYPRSFQNDKSICMDLDVSALFLPEDSTIYPPNALLTQVTVPELSTRYCGKSRPHFFTGVTNVVIRLFNIILPDFAIFGEKDYQQYFIIKTCIQNLFLPITICSLPTIREPNGLALSSRNHYLSDTQKQEASSIYKSLCLAKQSVSNGTQDRTSLDRLIQTHLSPSIDIDYIAYVDSNSLLPSHTIKPGNRILFAGNLNQTRLIDNIAL